MGRLEGSVAWVTGSSRGIGAEIARLFAKEGAAVALHGRDEAAASAVAGTIWQDGGKVCVTLGDVTRAVDLERMNAQIEAELGPIDILVANAGGNFVPLGPAELIPEDGWRITIDGNLTATFLTTRSVLPGMKKRKRGRIVTVSSAAARRANGVSPIAYAAAKAGIEIFTQHLAAQVGPWNIRANCIAPETILTKRNLKRIPQAQQEELADEHPLKRLGTPRDVADAALFFASEASAWITGTVLDVAGGAVMVR